MKSIQLGILLSWDSANSSRFPCSSPSAAAEGWHVDCSPSALPGQTGLSSSSPGGPGAPLPRSPGCPRGRQGHENPAAQHHCSTGGAAPPGRGCRQRGQVPAGPRSPPSTHQGHPPVRIPLSPAASPCPQHHSAPSCSIWLWTEAFTGWVGSGHRAAPRVLAALPAGAGGSSRPPRCRHDLTCARAGLAPTARTPQPCPGRAPLPSLVNTVINTIIRFNI